MDQEAPLDSAPTPQLPNRKQTPPPRGIKRRWPSPAPVGNTHSSRTGSSHEARPTSSSSPPRKITKISPSSAGMQAISPERSSAVKLTKTGRVSRAAKGRRVHSCEECGKTYTRAEHLRRHQQNHKPGAFACDIPGCHRSFNREDLLTRHKARHHDIHNTPGRRASVDSHPPAPLDGNRRGSHLIPVVAGDVETQSSPTLQQSVTTPTTHAEHDSAPPRKTYIPFSELSLGMEMTIPVGGSNSANYLGLWPASPSYSSSLESPTQELAFGGALPYHTRTLAARSRNMSSTATHGVWAPLGKCHSPTSVGSSTHVPHRGQCNISHFPVNLGRPNTSPGSDLSCESNFANCDGILGQQFFDPALTHKSSFVSTPERDIMEDALLGSPMSRVAIPPDFGSDGTSFQKEDSYLASYWHWIHPQFPIIQRSAHIRQAASPLLTAAMLAIGAHMLQTHDACNYGRILHERCLKVLKQRTASNTHTYRICDMQAIVLIELFSIFRSRRPPLEFSHEFQSVYRALACDTQLLEQDVTIGAFSLALAQDIEYKQYILLACYILDQQQSSLFGRQPADCLFTPGMHLPFPRSQSEFGTPFGSLLQSQCPRMLYQAISEKTGIAATSEEPFNAFQSSLMLLCLTDTNTNLDLCGFDLDDDPEVSPLFLAIEQSTRTKIIYHASMLCKNSPVRQLLAVAGESWVMSEKLGSEMDFTLAQQEAKQWAEGILPALAPSHLLGSQPAIERALYHAMEILRLHMRHPKTGLLYQEWSIYLASIVIWARAYVMSNTKRSSHRLSIPSPTETRHSQRNERDLEQNVAALLRTGPTSCFGEKEATNVLVWTTKKIEQVNVPHNCGVTNGALDVLRKLVLRGEEPGWFGA